MRPSGIVEENQYNIGHICTALQCARGLGDRTAFRFISAAGVRVDLSYADLDIRSSKFANILKKLGFSRHDTFFTFLPKSPEQVVAFLGTLKLPAVAGTLFANFGEEALLDRLGDSRARGIITKSRFLKRIAEIRPRLPQLKYILAIDLETHQDESILSYPLLMKESSGIFDVPLTGRDTPSVLHYTSGSTGKPKGVLHVHNSVVLQNHTSGHVLDLKDDDIFWCTADPGWVTGTSYGIIGPCSLGITQVSYEGGYNPQKWFRILKEENVSVWYTAPTALRMLMQEDPAIFNPADLEKVRCIFSVGEPLNPEIISWARKILHKDIYDTYFQTETGSIMIANRPGLPIRPGSMGKPVETIDAAVLDDLGNAVKDKQPGNLCLKAGWASMFAAYLNNPAAYEQKFRNGYYYTGDQAVRDQDGYFWFSARSDDVINTAGHLISPFEIESALLEIEEVAEAAVVGVPDKILFEKVVAFVKLRKESAEKEDLDLKIRLFITNKVSSIATPREIIFTDVIPKNKSGKIMRRFLRATYQGQDPGDTSTMEE